MKHSMTYAIAVRVAICILLGVAGGWLISEGSYQLNKNPESRDEARKVVLEIPAGTSDRLAKGEPVPEIPTNMTFVVGDLLVVKNDDTVSHQLGPVWVPPQSSGVLQIDVADEYSYACTFEKSQYFGLTVLPQLTLASRFQGAMTVGLPTAMILGLYSIIVWPLNKQKAAEA
jgi:hypothetical protein